VVPFALRGIIWYQGESNHTRPAEYHALFPAMIRQWRAAFDQGELPFYFVQLPNYEQPSDATGELWAYLREAQAAALALPRTGMAVTIDVGEAKDLHPPNKVDVGRRLALLARAQVYGEEIAAESPRAIAFERAAGAMRVRLSAAAGLHLREGKSAGAEVAGADRVFHPATLTFDRETIVARAAAVPEPVAVRYAWANAPEVSLFNGAGLPVAPFRSDNW
jgi:sialate O-acetylesterase